MFFDFSRLTAPPDDHNFPGRLMVSFGLAMTGSAYLVSSGSSAKMRAAGAAFLLAGVFGMVACVGENVYDNANPGLLPVARPF